MLIQVQFIKRELLIATTAIGQLARENELNLRMMATVPAFLLAWGSYRAGGLVCREYRYISEATYPTLQVKG